MPAAEKAIGRPSLWVVVALGLLTALVAALLAFANLATQSVQEVRSMPDGASREPGLVYYVKGSTVASTRWQTVRNELLRGATGTARLSEADLNAWASSAFVRARPSKRPSKDGEKEPAGPSLFGIAVEVSGVNFRIVDGQLQCVALIEFPKLLPNQRLVYQVRGDLGTAPGGGLKFVPKEGTIGRAPVAQIPLFGGLVHNRIAGLLLKAPEATELSAKWSSIKQVKIEGPVIELTLQ